MVTKIVLLGASSVGKTSIANWLTGNPNNFNHYRETIGSDFQILNVNDVDQISIWDLGGAERFRPIASYLRNVAIICLVIDKSKRNALEELAQRLTELKNIRPDARFIILGNQTTDDDFIDEQVIARFIANNNLPANTTYLAVNPKHDIGKTALIENLTSGLPNPAAEHALAETAASGSELLDEPEHSNPSSLSDISMHILSGFIIAIGAAAVAIAFAALNAAALSTVGLAVAGTGIATMLVGFGVLFAKRRTPEDTKMPLDTGMSDESPEHEFSLP